MAQIRKVYKILKFKNIMKSIKLEEIKKKFERVDFENIDSVVDFCKFIHQKDFIEESIKYEIKEFSIISMFDNFSNEWVYMVELEYKIEGKYYEEGLIEFMRKEFCFTREEFE